MSLRDMLRFHADKFIAVLNLLTAVENLLSDPQHSLLGTNETAYITSKLDEMLAQLAELQLNVSRKKAEQLRYALTSNNSSPSRLARYCEDLRERIQDELEG